MSMEVRNRSQLNEGLRKLLQLDLEMGTDKRARFIVFTEVEGSRGWLECEQNDHAIQNITTMRVPNIKRV